MIKYTNYLNPSQVTDTRTNTACQTSVETQLGCNSGEDDEINSYGDKHYTTTTTPTTPTKPTKSPTKSISAKKKVKAQAAYTKSSGRVVYTGSRTLYTAGRPPWYDSQGQLKKPFVIGICGGSASGKTTASRKIIEALDVPWVSLLSMDSFYKVILEIDFLEQIIWKTVECFYKQF
ncbi:hypothetical protein LOTGIDRAFT_176341 [Lottia gigantea]|uniref:Phosphoribulokinase/uridine kinase domain-containing protein n=1 Tax=Lottia gigantea TaxID=225164 RepID=V4B2W2_LOTGI|nr:hypothetical protein LOTGIDRAFT_176341 [Lottia gigantea]ESP04443.1 hypothetical protein LOTGIDRAFT_176341 [Lottia gigantea]